MKKSVGYDPEAGDQECRAEHEDDDRQRVGVKKPSEWNRSSSADEESCDAEKHGHRIELSDLPTVEIAQLPDAQLDPGHMAEGARECGGLVEWDLARTRNLRPHLRYLAEFTPAQRQEAMSAAGLPFAKMSLPQQQQFIAHALSPDGEPFQSLEELAGAVLRVDYSQPGWYQWGDPGMAHSWFSWVVPIEPGLEGRRVLRPPLRERTREAALAAVRRLDPRLREAALYSVREWFSMHQPPSEGEGLIMVLGRRR